MQPKKGTNILLMTEVHPILTNLLAFWVLGEILIQGGNEFEQVEKWPLYSIHVSPSLLSSHWHEVWMLGGRWPSNRNEVEPAEVSQEGNVEANAEPPPQISQQELLLLTCYLAPRLLAQGFQKERGSQPVDPTVLCEKPVRNA